MKYAKLSRALISLALCGGLLSACHHDDDNSVVVNQPQPQTPTVTTMSMEVGVALGAVSGADITVIDAATGEPVAGAQGTLDENGMATLEVPDDMGPMIVVASGNSSATYFDEGANQHLPFADGQQLRAYVSAVQAQVGVTTLTELAAAIIAAAGDSSGDTINSVNQQIATLLAPGVTDITALPMAVTNLAAGQFTTDQASIYAATLAALAKLAEGENAPALNVLHTLSVDILDGHIDGRLAEMSFENPVYSGATFLTDYLAALTAIVTNYGNAELAGALNDIFRTGNWTTQLAGLEALLATIDFSNIDLSSLPQTTIDPPQVELPSVLSGYSSNFKLTTENEGSPYTLNQVVNFSFSAMGVMSLDIDPEQNNGVEIVVETFTEVGTELEWMDSAGGFAYRLSILNNQVHEINVFSADMTFVGQFVPYQAGSDIENLNLVTQFAGTYQVEATSGTHSRGSVTIGSDGAVDFDTTVMFGADSINAIFDRTFIEDEPRVQINYGSDDDGAVINLYLKTDLSAIASIQFRYRTHGIDIRVSVTEGGGTGGGDGGSGSGSGISGTVNGQMLAYSEIQQYVFTQGSDGPIVIPDSATIAAVKDPASGDACQQCVDSWAITMPAEVGTHQCQHVTSGQPGAVYLNMDSISYSTYGNGFIEPQCTITVTEVLENGIKGTFTATLFQVVDGENVEFATITDGSFDVVEQ